jgi:group I intron endonuclease
MKFFIYKTTNNINKKEYIGQHISSNSDNSYLGSGLILKRAIEKYGKKNFSKVNLEECFSFEELNNREIFWIKKLNTIVPNGYNIREGGNNSPMSESSRKKLIVSQKGKWAGEKNPNFGGKITGTPEMRNKLSIMKKEEFKNNTEYKLKVSRKGKKQPIEWVERQRKMVSGKGNPRYIKVDEKIIPEIIDLYVNKNKRLVEIGNIFNLSYFKIKKILIENNIEIIRYYN